MQSTIKNIQNELTMLKEDLDDFRSEKNGGVFDFDIGEIVVKAKHDPVADHPLSSKDNYTQRRYLILLLSVAQFEPDKLYESLLLAHKIAYGCGYLKDGDLTDEYAASHTLTITQVDELVALFAEDDLRLLLIEEMLLIAGKFEKGLKSAADYISQICEIFKLSGNDLTFLSQMSAVILAEDPVLYTCGIRNKYNIFKCYLKKFNLSGLRKLFTPPISSEYDKIPFYDADLFFQHNVLTVYSEYIGTVTTNSSIPWYRVNSLPSQQEHKTVTKTYQFKGDFLLMVQHLNQIDKPIGVEFHPLDSDINGVRAYFNSCSEMEGYY